MPPITVVIADPDRARRATCLRLLQGAKGIRVVGEARNGLEAIAAARRRPRILFLDLNLSRSNGVSLLPVFRQKSPQTRAILLVGRVSEAHLLDALSHGARGYLENKALHTFLVKAVRTVDAGEAWVPRKMVAKIMEHLVQLTTRAEGREASLASAELVS